MQNILHTMGIPVWRARDGASENTPPPFDYRFIFVYETSSLDAALLSKIITALGVTEQEVHCLAVDTPSALEGQAWADVPVVVFGDALSPFAPANAIQTVTLNQLAANTGAKKVLWQQLKMLINR